MKPVCVTGADGFIGSHLVERLLTAGYHVRALSQYNSFGYRGWLDFSPERDNKKLEVISGDIRDYQCVNNFIKDAGAVLHLASLIAIPYSYQAVQSYIDTNITGTFNVMQAAREHAIERVIHTSTSEVYGTAQSVPITETHPLNAQSPYAATKIAADQMALSYYRSFDLPVIILRPFNTYGPRQSARAVIPAIITQLLDGQQELHLGALHPTRDFNYVTDTADGFIAALTAPLNKIVGQVINLGSGFEISIGDTANMIAEIMGCSIKIRCDRKRLRPEKSEVERLFCSNDKARNLMGWKPVYGQHDGFRKGLEKTIKWFSEQDNRALYRTGGYVI